MAKIIKQRSLFDMDNYKLYLKMAQADKLPYSVVLTNYTTDIISPVRPVYFMQNMISPLAFVAGAMIKRDVLAYAKGKGTEEKIYTPDVDRGQLKYFSFAAPKRLTLAKRKVHCIDISAAYATVLFREKMITPETYKFLKTIPKKDRLACVGMIASNKNIYNYDEKNQLISSGNILNPLAPYFFYCVKRVADTMSECASAIKNDFLYFWVDCIYFDDSDGANRKVISDKLTESLFNYKYEELNDFTFYDNKTCYKIIYRNPEGKLKEFSMPKNDFSQNKEIIKILGLHDKKYSITKKD